MRLSIKRNGTVLPLRSYHIVCHRSDIHARLDPYRGIAYFKLRVEKNEINI